MECAQLARLLINGSIANRAELLCSYPQFTSAQVAEELQQQCYEAWTHEPTAIGRIAETARSLSDISKDPIVFGYSEWINAIEALVAGDLNSCLSFINSSEKEFLNAEQTHLSAKTQTSKLYVLGLLGRYDEAIECGLKAREVFLRHSDLYSAGKIEHNIGNLYWRRDLYKESEPFLSSAHSRFEQIKDERQLAMVENCQAFVKTLQNDFSVAESLYNVALERAIRNDLKVTAAEIETGLSNLYLFKGQYDLALEFLERSRQKYDDLTMPLQSAGCDLEIADIYLELNLLPEALQRYDLCISEFTVLGGQAELARTYLGRARTLQRLGHSDKVRENLDTAQELFENEENSVAVGSVRFARAQEMLNSGFLESADEEISVALRMFEEGANIRLALFARWLRCEIYFASGHSEGLEAELADILAEAMDSREVQYLCLVLLGRITREPKYFISAVELVERSRIGLAAPELRTSFFAEKLTPYNELVKISLRRKEYKEALHWHERSRSRSMVDVAEIDHGKDEDERTRRIREELNWFQRRLASTGTANEIERSTAIKLRKNVERLEQEYAESLRRTHARNRSSILPGIGLNIEEFRQRLGDATAVEFIALDGKISVFVISKQHFSAVEDYLDEDELNSSIEQYLFQVSTGRFLERLSQSDKISALERIKIRSRKLFDLIFDPIKHLISSDRIVILASGKMHTLPFHSLFDGQKYLCERSVISYSPSLTLLNEKLGSPPCDRKTALIAGVADSVIPLANVEIAEVSRYFERAACLSGPETTIASIRDSLPGNGVFHLSCHGQFRPDNPSFSALDLFNEKMTANDVRTLPLERCIVVLSSCEGAINEVARGEDLVGLTGAFFAAGASTLIHSLWRVNDEAALELMVEFYKGFATGSDPAKALNRAQRSMIEQEKDPYLWAPFIVTGGW